MIWRAARCLRHCDRLSSPESVMLGQLMIGVSETSRSFHHSLPVELESDSVESCKMLEAM